MPELITTLGPVGKDELGMVLPHEHVFVDLRTPDQPGYAQADPDDVVALMAPELERARAAGVTALVECSTVGVGRRVDILRQVSEATDFPLVTPTGVYREPWVPDWVHAAGEEDLFRWMLGELQGEIEGSGVQAGFIKLSAGDEGLTECERKILRAAARAGIETGAAIASHTIRGDVVREQLDIITATGYTPERFVWVHASAEEQVELNLEMAERGAWIEYDWIGEPADDDAFLMRIQRMMSAGFGEQLLLSHDRGWYDPAQPGGGEPRPFTYISEVFLPKLRAAGLEAETVRMLVENNPFRAFGR